MLSFFDEYGMDTTFTNGPDISRGAFEYFFLMSDCPSEQCYLGHYVSSKDRVSELIELCELFVNSGSMPNTKLIIYSPDVFHSPIRRALDGCVEFEIIDILKI